MIPVVVLLTAAGRHDHDRRQPVRSHGPLRQCGRALVGPRHPRRHRREAPRDGIGCARAGGDLRLRGEPPEHVRHPGRLLVPFRTRSARSPRSRSAGFRSSAGTSAGRVTSSWIAATRTARRSSGAGGNSWAWGCRSSSSPRGRGAPTAAWAGSRRAASCWRSRRRLPLVPLSIAGTRSVLPKGSLTAVPGRRHAGRPPAAPRPGPRGGADDRRREGAGGGGPGIISARVEALERERGSWTAVLAIEPALDGSSGSACPPVRGARRPRARSPALDAPLAEAAERGPAARDGPARADGARRCTPRFGIDPTQTRPSSEALLRRVRRGRAAPAHQHRSSTSATGARSDVQLPYGAVRRRRGPILPSHCAAGASGRAVRRDSQGHRSPRGPARALR